MARRFPVSDPEGVTAAQAAARPIKDAHTIWELVLHIAAWDGAVRRRMTGVAVKLSAAKNFPPVLDTSEEAWAKTLEQVRRVHEELIAAVEKFPEKSLASRYRARRARTTIFITCCMA